ncbi:MAG: alpha/beta fold hydrolase [Pseudomonadales bacterium]|nr:alpha/beta fold hydrolase [Pseudomonadales bacterium]
MTTTIHVAGDGSTLLVLAHGAGAPCDHPHMQSIAEALEAEGIGTLRFNFPFMEEGRRRVDKTEVCLDAIGDALNAARELAPDARLYLGGHSFGGRMATHYAVERDINEIQGLVLFSFPLHVAKKPDTKRANHLPNVRLPMLFLSGTRDALAEQELLKRVSAGLNSASLHWLDKADHSFKILKRTRKETEDVYTEAARVARAWITSVN